MKMLISFFDRQSERERETVFGRNPPGIDQRTNFAMAKVIPLQNGKQFSQTAAAAAV